MLLTLNEPPAGGEKRSAVRQLVGGGDKWDLSHWDFILATPQNSLLLLKYINYGWTEKEII